MVRALSQPPGEGSYPRPGSSQSQGSAWSSGTRPSSSGSPAHRRHSSQTPHSVKYTSNSQHKRNSSLSQIGSNFPSTNPSQKPQSTSSEITVPRHNLEAGLTQFEVSPATSGDSETFEILNLPDFSSLAISDSDLVLNESLEMNTGGHHDLPVFLQPGSSFTFSSPPSVLNTREELRSVGSLSHSSDANHAFNATEILKENRRLSHCLLESNKLLRKLEGEKVCDISGFQKAREFILKVKKESADTNGAVDSKVNRKDSKKEKKSDKKSETKNGVENNVSLLNLSQQLDVAEEAQAQLSQDLQRVTQEKLETQNQLASLNLEYETLKSNVEQLTRDKWGVTQVNNDLQQRLQQTVALAHMQAEGNQSRLQEEVGRMLFQLEEERKVTANLSKNLELERRKVESLEQKAKGSSSTRGSSKGEKRRSSLLPDEVRENETRLAQSMELYRQRCDNLGTSLANCQAKLEDERYCGDLTTEVNKLRKLLAEEKKKVGGESVRLGETQALFEQIYLDYSTTIESVKQAQHEKRMKSQQQSVLNNIAESNMRDNVDSMTARLMQAEEALAQERRENQQARERLAQAALDLEALPLLQAQVEVYQSDFNAERMARERIAGEKADLEEQLRKAGVHKAAPVQGGGQPGGFDGFQQRGGGNQTNQYATGNRGPAFEPPRAGGLERGAGGMERGVAGLDRGAVRERVNSLAGREQQYDNIPRTVNIRPDPEQEAEPPEAFTCPKCNREFRNTTLLTRHVNDCLDRDF